MGTSHGSNCSSQPSLVDGNSTTGLKHVGEPNDMIDDRLLRCILAPKFEFVLCSSNSSKRRVDSLEHATHSQAAATPATVRLSLLAAGVAVSALSTFRANEQLGRPLPRLPTAHVHVQLPLGPEQSPERPHELRRRRQRPLVRARNGCVHVSVCMCMCMDSTDACAWLSLCSMQSPHAHRARQAASLRDAQAAPPCTRTGAAATGHRRAPPAAVTKAERRLHKQQQPQTGAHVSALATAHSWRPIVVVVICAGRIESLGALQRRYPPQLGASAASSERCCRVRVEPLGPSGDPRAPSAQPQCPQQ